MADPQFMAAGQKQMSQAQQRPSFAGPASGIAPSVSKENLSELAGDFSNISRRTRMLEEGTSSLRKRLQMTDQTTISQIKDLNKKIKVLESELFDYRREFVDLKDKTKLIVRELKDCAKSDEVKIVQNYIDLWEPMNFVTRAEFDRIIEERIQSAVSSLGQSSISPLKNMAKRKNSSDEY